MKLVSIVIPCYNSEGFVHKAIACALAQTYQPCEIILVDNNSTDQTLQILQDYAARYPDNIRVVLETRRGAPAARNKGLTEARGEWIQFLDSDDEILPNKVLNQMNVAVNGAFDLIVGNRIKQRLTSNGLTERTVKAESKNIWKALIETKLNSTSALLWRRTSIEAVNGWNENMIYSSDEYELIFRMLQNNASIGFCDMTETIVVMRRDSVNRSTDNEKLYKILTSFVQLRCDIRSYLASTGRLTRELERAYRRRIYFRLIAYQTRIPGFVDKQLKNLDIEAPINYLLRQKIKRIRRAIIGK